MNDTHPDIIAADSISATPGTTETVIVVTFTPVKGTDPVSATRRMLKHAGRMCGLRCVSLTASGWPGIVPLASTPTKKEPLT